MQIQEKSFDQAKNMPETRPFLFLQECIMSDDEMLLLFLGRIGQNHRLIDWQNYFGIDESILCEGFQLVLDQV